VTVTLQRGGAKISHPCFVGDVERDVQDHAVAESPQRSRTRTETEDAEHRGGAVKRARRPVLGNRGSIVETHRRDRAQPTLLHAEREVVVEVDQHPSGPQQGCVAAEPPSRDDRGGGGDRDVIADSHYPSRACGSAVAGRYPSSWYQAIVSAAPVSRSVGAWKSSTRSALLT